MGGPGTWSDPLEVRGLTRGFSHLSGGPDEAQFVSVFNLQKKQRAEKRRVDSSTEDRSSFKQRRLQLSDTAEEEVQEEVQTEAQVNSVLTCCTNQVSS